MNRDFPSSKSEKVSTVESVQLEMHGHVRRLADPSRPGESVKACILRVSRETGLRFCEVRRLWYREWRVIPTHISDRLRQAVEAHERNIERQIADLKQRQSRLYALTHHSSDPEFYRERAAGPGEGTDVAGGQDF